jgi:hypothetical protein
MKRIVLTVVLSSLATLGVVNLLGLAKGGYSEKVVLDNKKVTVTERVIDPGVARDPHIRQSDQIIVFLNDTAYDRLDPQTGKVEQRKRKAGEVIWHDKGENAPKLTTRGAQPMRSLVIALK